MAVGLAAVVALALVLGACGGRTPLTEAPPVLGPDAGPASDLPRPFDVGSFDVGPPVDLVAVDLGVDVGIDVAPLPVGCHTDLDCPPNSACLAPDQQPGCQDDCIPAAPQTCASDADCSGLPAGICGYASAFLVPGATCGCAGEQESCTIGCTSDDQCGEGQRCDPVSHRCGAITGCHADRECPVNFFCLQAKNAPPTCTRWSCVSGKDCPGGLCVTGRCFPQPGQCDQPRSTTYQVTSLFTDVPRFVVLKRDGARDLCFLIEFELGGASALPMYRIQPPTGYQATRVQVSPHASDCDDPVSSLGTMDWIPATDAVGWVAIMPGTSGCVSSVHVRMSFPISSPDVPSAELMSTTAAGSCSF
jgi:hypothetical protein